MGRMSDSATDWLLVSRATMVEERRKRKEALAVYKDRRKNEAADGRLDGLNNW